MQAWNALISVREQGFRRAFDVFGEFGGVKRTERSPESLAFLARLIPVTRTFIFNSPEEFEDPVAVIALETVGAWAGQALFTGGRKSGILSSGLNNKDPVENRERARRRDSGHGASPLHGV